MGTGKGGGRDVVGSYLWLNEKEVGEVLESNSTQLQILMVSPL
jgi:hypothetical protein